MVSQIPELRLAVLDSRGTTVDMVRGRGEVVLCPSRNWEEGDVVVLWTDVWPIHLTLKLDDRIPAAQVYLAADRMDYPVPFGQELLAYPPESFSTACRLEAKAIPVPEHRRVLSENPLDRRGETDCYPHCSATVETRGEAVFAARNTIDGSLENTDHGKWPFTSWGENENPHAEITIRFGRPVLAEELRVWLRADFPHDNWWQEATLVCSDGTREHLRFEKTGKMQAFPLEPRQVTWAKLTELKHDPLDPSPFPALTQWAVVGREIPAE